MNSRRKLIGLGLIIGAVAATAHTIPVVRRSIHPLVSRLRGRVTIEQRLQSLEATGRTRIRDAVRNAGLAYPPVDLVLAGFKAERRLDVYAGHESGSLVLVKSYPIQGASGTLGPKLREGDHQVPEGLYRIISLNPNSRFHLSIKLDYPNEMDRSIAAAEDRANLGGDIFMHGGSASVGCIAMGDEAIEELFALTADTGFEAVQVVLAPMDFRRMDMPS
jgi:murein L,D-transpeptidase YafK